MPKAFAQKDRVSVDEWRALPITFDTPTAERVYGCNARYLIRNHSQYGGVRVAGKWSWSKSKAAQVLGIEA